MSEIDPMALLTHETAWTLDRDGQRWTLKVWVARGGAGTVKREYSIDNERDAGVAIAKLGRPVIQDWQGVR